MNYKVFQNVVYKVHITYEVDDDEVIWSEESKDLYVNPKTFHECIDQGILRTTYGYQTPLWKVLNGETIE